MAISIVPGLAVRRYAERPAAALRRAGHQVSLHRPPAWRGEPTDLVSYGDRLAATLVDDGHDVDLLIGLSVGTQAAAVAAAASDRVRHLLLVSPTVDPPRRSRRALLRAWTSDGDDHRDSPALLAQLPDWAHAGPRRIYHGMVSATRVPLEEVLRRVACPVTLVHADSDLLSALAFTLALTDLDHVDALVMPDAPHSWPVGDPERFVQLVEDLVGPSDTAG